MSEIGEGAPKQSIVLKLVLSEKKHKAYRSKNMGAIADALVGVVQSNGGQLPLKRESIISPVYHENGSAKPLDMKGEHYLFFASGRTPNGQDVIFPLLDRKSLEAHVAANIEVPHVSALISPEIAKTLMDPDNYVGDKKNQLVGPIKAVLRSMLRYSKLDEGTKMSLVLRPLEIQTTQS